MTNQIYRGNSLLKKSGVGIEWTPELLDEYIKCSKSPIYFIENYVKIINVDRGLVAFELYQYQKEIIEALQNQRYNIITMARQSGKTTTLVGYILWYIIFNSEKTVAVLANKGDTAREILGRIQLSYSHLPKWLQQGVSEWHKGSFILENNSKVLAAASSSDSIRGFSINFLYVDETAFVRNWDEFYTSVFPTITSGKETQVCLISTPNGLNHFHDIWDLAVKKKNDYYPILVTWDKVPGRDEEWKEKTLSGMNFNYEKFNQEFNCQFQGSSGTLISGWRLEQLNEEVQNPLQSMNGLLQYEPPIVENAENKNHHKYMMICDVSRGKGLDYSAFHVIDVTAVPYKQVCTFRDNMISPIDYAETIFRVAKAYNNAEVLVEINDIGQQVADSVWYDFEYEGILYTQNNGRLGKRISSGFGGKIGDRGIRTTKTVKAVGCSILKLLIEQKKLIVNDKMTYKELTTFSQKGVSYEAEPGKTDDLVMGLVLFAWLSDQPYFRDITEINTLQKLREKTDDDMKEELLPLGFYHDGREEIEESILNDERKELTLKDWPEEMFSVPSSDGIYRPFNPWKDII